MLIHVTAKQFDLAGVASIDVPSPNFGDTRRRANRIATLDGGAVTNDFGYAEADRNMTFEWQPTEADDATMLRLVRLHDRVRVSTPLGLLECQISGYSNRAGTAALSLNVLEKLSE